MRRELEVFICMRCFSIDSSARARELFAQIDALLTNHSMFNVRNGGSTLVNMLFWIIAVFEGTEARFALTRANLFILQISLARVNMSCLMKYLLDENVTSGNLNFGWA